MCSFSGGVVPGVLVHSSNGGASRSDAPLLGSQSR